MNIHINGVSHIVNENDSKYIYVTKISIDRFRAVAARIRTTTLFLYSHRNSSKSAATKDWKLLCLLMASAGSYCMFPKTCHWKLINTVFGLNPILNVLTRLESSEM